MKKINLALVGVTGVVGRTFLSILEEKNLPIENLYPFASKRSAGKKITFKGNEYTIEELSVDNIKDKDIDYALFSAGGNTSKEFAPEFAKLGIVVIDNSSYWRMEDDVPLIVPEVNPHAIDSNKGIIANPNCSTIQAVVALKPLHDKYKIKRIVFSTYQSVSGAGIAGIKDLEEGIKGNPPKKFIYPIAGNCIPHIDDFLDNGYTKEEMKMIEETRKILGEPNMKITATTVRVPVKGAHSESVNVEFENPFDLDELVNELENAKGIKVINDCKNNKYPLPLDVEGKDDVYVGRIRRDESVENGINMWIVADNIRKGAALNTIQILEEIIRNK